MQHLTIGQQIFPMYDEKLSKVGNPAAVAREERDRLDSDRMVVGDAQITETEVPSQNNETTSDKLKNIDFKLSWYAQRKFAQGANLPYISGSTPPEKKNDIYVDVDNTPKVTLKRKLKSSQLIDRISYSAHHKHSNGKKQVLKVVLKKIIFKPQKKNEEEIFATPANKGQKSFSMNLRSKEKEKQESDEAQEEAMEGLLSLDFSSEDERPLGQIKRIGKRNHPKQNSPEQPNPTNDEPSECSNLSVSNTETTTGEQGNLLVERERPKRACKIRRPAYKLYKGKNDFRGNRNFRKDTTSPVLESANSKNRKRTSKIQNGPKQKKGRTSRVKDMQSSCNSGGTTVPDQGETKQRVRTRSSVRNGMKAASNSVGSLKDNMSMPSTSTYGLLDKEEIISDQSEMTEDEDIIILNPRYRAVNGLEAASEHVESHMDDMPMPSTSTYGLPDKETVPDKSVATIPDEDDASSFSTRSTSELEAASRDKTVPDQSKTTRTDAENTAKVTTRSTTRIKLEEASKYIVRVKNENIVYTEASFSNVNESEGMGSEVEVEPRIDETEKESNPVQTSEPYTAIGAQLQEKSLNSEKYSRIDQWLQDGMNAEPSSSAATRQVDNADIYEFNETGDPPVSEAFTRRQTRSATRSNLFLKLNEEVAIRADFNPAFRQNRVMSVDLVPLSTVDPKNILARIPSDDDSVTEVNNADSVCEVIEQDSVSEMIDADSASEVIEAEAAQSVTPVVPVNVKVEPENNNVNELPSRRVARKNNPRHTSPEKRNKRDDEARLGKKAGTLPNDSQTLIAAPVYWPTDEEWASPLVFIEKIRKEAEQFGICKIVPPASFKPECVMPDDLLFSVDNQYIYRAFQRWGSATREMRAINIKLKNSAVAGGLRVPLIEGLEANLPLLARLMKDSGINEGTVEKHKLYSKVLGSMNIKPNKRLINKMQAIFYVILVPYLSMTHKDRIELFKKVDSEWEKKHQKLKERARSPLSKQKALLGDTQSDSDVEDHSSLLVQECVTRGRHMKLGFFKKIAGKAHDRFFPDKNKSSPTEIEKAYWRIVMRGNDHVCVYSAFVDTASNSLGFPHLKSKSAIAKHPWNLKNINDDSHSVLRSLGKVLTVTVPTIHVGMIFSTHHWYRDPHGLPWIEFHHEGAPKVWYGISEQQGDQFRKAVEKVSPISCQNKKIWLPSDTTMIPPEVLLEQDVQLSQTIQKPGEFVVVFPKAFTSSICTGFTISESVCFAPMQWMFSAPQNFRELAESYEPPMFCLEQLLIAIACDNKVTSKTLLQQTYTALKVIVDEECHNRAGLTGLGINQVERELKKPKKGIWHVREHSTDCDVCHSILYMSRVVNEAEKKKWKYCLTHGFQILEASKDEDHSTVLVETYFTTEYLMSVMTGLEEKLDMGAQNITLV